MTGRVKSSLVLLGLLLLFSACTGLAAAMITGPADFSPEATEEIETDSELQPDCTPLAAQDLGALTGSSAAAVGAPAEEQLKTGIFPEILTPPPL